MKLKRKTTAAQHKATVSARLLIKRLKAIHRYYLSFGENSPDRSRRFKIFQPLFSDWSDK
jgi:hypothetical protein